VTIKLVFCHCNLKASFLSPCDLKAGFVSLCDIKAELKLINSFSFSYYLTVTLYSRTGTEVENTERSKLLEEIEKLMNFETSIFTYSTHEDEIVIEEVGEVGDEIKTELIDPVVENTAAVTSVRKNEEETGLKRRLNAKKAADKERDDALEKSTAFLDSLILTPTIS